MDMQNIDPAMAARVWQRVQAANEEKCTEKPACPLEGIRTVPAVPEAKATCKKMQQRSCGTEFPIWLVILLLCM